MTKCAFPQSVGAFNTTPPVCYSNAYPPRWRTNNRNTQVHRALGIQIVRGEAYCAFDVHRGVCYCKTHYLFSKAILRGQTFYDENNNKIVLLGTERYEAERCVENYERNIDNARRQARDELADRMAIPENRTRRNTLQNEGRAQNTATQEIRETIDYIYSWIDDDPDSAAITKGYLIYLLKARVPRSPRLLENHPDPSLERHSNPQVMLAKYPECLGFFSSDASVRVIENKTVVEFDAESVKLAIYSIRMCWDMQQPCSEVHGGPRLGCEFPKYSVYWNASIFTTDGNRRKFSLPPYKSCQNLPGDPFMPLSAEQEAVVAEVELFGRACKNFTARANAILGTHKARIRFLRAQQCDDMHLTRRQARTLVTHEFGHPDLHGARDELLAIIGLDSSGARQFLPQQGLFASDLQHGIFNGQLFATAKSSVSQTVIPWYKELGYPSSKSRTMLLDVGLINQLREIGQQQFGISVLESKAREFLMQFFCEGTIENKDYGWNIHTLIDNDDVLESLYRNSLEESFGIQVTYPTHIQPMGSTLIAHHAKTRVVSGSESINNPRCDLSWRTNPPIVLPSALGTKQTFMDYLSPGTMFFSSVAIVILGIISNKCWIKRSIDLSSPDTIIDSDSFAKVHFDVREFGTASLTFIFRPNLDLIKVFVTPTQVDWIHWVPLPRLILPESYYHVFGLDYLQAFALFHLIPIWIYFVNLED